MRGMPLSSELTRCPSFELLHRQGRDQAASLMGREVGKGQSSKGRKKENLGTGDYRLGESVPG